jgi:hypothetical protein
MIWIQRVSPRNQAIYVQTSQPRGLSGNRPSSEAQGPDSREGDLQPPKDPDVMANWCVKVYFVGIMCIYVVQTLLRRYVMSNFWTKPNGGRLRGTIIFRIHMTDLHS